MKYLFLILFLSGCSPFKDGDVEYIEVQNTFVDCAKSLVFTVALPEYYSYMHFGDNCDYSFKSNSYNGEKYVECNVNATYRDFQINKLSGIIYLSNFNTDCGYSYEGYTSAITYEIVSSTLFLGGYRGAN